MREGTAREFLGFVEKCYIKSLREIGHDLINVAEGGDGGKLGELTPEGRARKIAALIGNTHTRGTKRSIESRKQQSESARRYFAEHPEASARSGASRLGIKQSDETCAKKSAALIGQKTALGVKHSEESRRQRSIWLRGNTNGLGAVHSEESKAQVSESLRRYNADPANQSAIAERRIRQSETMKALHAKKKENKAVSS